MTNKTNEELLENYLEMIGSEGWKQLQESLKSRLDAMEKGAFFIEDEKEFHYSRGVYSVLSELVNFRELVEVAYKESLAEDEY